MKFLSYTKADEARYAQTLALRDAVLRRPFGKSIYDENLSYEVENIFFGAVENDALVGTLNYFVKAPKIAQLCAFSVRPDLQHLGIGSQLVQNLFAELRAKEFEKCVVEARGSAVGFYEKQGFTVTSGPVKNVRLEIDDFIMEILLKKPTNRLSAG